MRAALRLRWKRVWALAPVTTNIPHLKSRPPTRANLTIMDCSIWVAAIAGMPYPRRTAARAKTIASIWPHLPRHQSAWRPYAMAWYRWPAGQWSNLRWTLKRYVKRYIQNRLEYVYIYVHAFDIFIYKLLNLQNGFDLHRSESSRSSLHGEFLNATIVIDVVVVVVVAVAVVWLSVRVNHTHISTLFWMSTIAACKFVVVVANSSANC